MSDEFDAVGLEQGRDRPMLLVHRKEWNAARLKPPRLRLVWSDKSDEPVIRRSERP